MAVAWASNSSRCPASTRSRSWTAAQSPPASTSAIKQGNTQPRSQPDPSGSRQASQKLVPATASDDARHARAMGFMLRVSGSNCLVQQHL